MLVSYTLYEVKDIGVKRGRIGKGGREGGREDREREGGREGGKGE